MAVITYRVGEQVALETLVELYQASTLGARRPIDDRARFAAMFAHANLVVTAWEDGVLVGVARALSDFAHSTYLADLAVRVSHQRAGIGRELIARVREAHGTETNLVLLSAPAAMAYYPRVGFTAAPNAFVIKAGEPLR
jgi:GNAT superfamily N-acetyltransferase